MYSPASLSRIKTTNLFSSVRDVRNFAATLTPQPSQYGIFNFQRDRLEKRLDAISLEFEDTISIVIWMEK